MIFSFSLLLLWNNWQIHTGKPSLFGTPPASDAAQAPGQQTAANGQPAPASTPSVPTTPAAAPSTVPGATTPAPTRAEQVVITTDVLRLTFDTTGGQPNKPTVLLDRSPELTYVVQSGLVGAPNGQSFPTHQTPFRLVSSERELTGDALKVAFEAESGGLKVTKTYTLHRGRYDID